MFWMSGSAGGQEQQASSASGAGQLPGSDAVKQRGFRPLQLPGSSLAGNQSQSSSSPWQALRFWQVGAQRSKQVPICAAAADTPGVADQQPHMQKSLSSMLFGKQKRHSSSGADAAARCLSIDPAASWRSSVDGSSNGRRASARSSDAGAAMVAAASAAAAAAATGGVMSSLASGEGPLSKSYSLLATKPGTQQEQILGKSLEIVAEDEREGRGKHLQDPCAPMMLCPPACLAQPWCAAMPHRFLQRPDGAHKATRNSFNMVHTWAVPCHVDALQTLLHLRSPLGAG
jgi:hypothetical protein